MDYNTNQLKYIIVKSYIWDTVLSTSGNSLLLTTKVVLDLKKQPVMLYTCTGL
jgi:hypothetical protein